MVVLLILLTGGDVHLYRDSSLAPLLDLRRRLKVVFDLLGGMIRDGFTLARSFELTDQWSCILSAGPFASCYYG